MTPDAPPIEPRPLNPLAALTLVLVFPGRTFRRLVERPHWIVPLAFVSLAVIVSGLLAFGAGFLDEQIELEALRTGTDPVEIRAGVPAFMIVSGLISVGSGVLIQTLLFMVIGRRLGGRGRFRQAFSAVCHASVPVGALALLMLALVPFSHRYIEGVNLAFIADPSTHPLIWGLARQLDLSSIWFFLLLGIAAEPVFGLSRRRARWLAVIFGVLSVLALCWMGSRDAGRGVDPFASWSSRASRSVEINYGVGTDEETLDDVAAACARALATIERLGGTATGGEAGAGDGERIDCYLYPSLEEKLRVTDSGAVAHRVEWANAVHLAWVEGAEPALTRELFKLVDAKAHGKVYTPLIRDGLAAYAGGTWAGLPVRDAAAELRERRVLPDLSLLVDDAMFVQLDERLSQPAAGSLVDLLVDERGTDAVRSLYSNMAGRPDAAVLFLESALEDSLAAIEDRWLEYLTRSADVRGAAPPDAE